MALNLEQKEQYLNELFETIRLVRSLKEFWRGILIN